MASRAYNRQYYLAHREEAIERSRQNRLQNVERERDRYRRRRLSGYRSPQQILRDEIKSEFWLAQNGQCYLCEESLESKEAAHLDHDHRCCPRAKVCRYCARGLSCEPCNLLIGNARDDVEKIERIARNLRAKLTEIDGRLASKPAQGALA
jgi:hypothetical protein